MQDREISSSVYAWDLHDEGVGQVLDNLVGMAHINSVYLIALMHKERHPWPESDDFPHNPARKSYTTEDSRAYWNVDKSRYARISPDTPGNFLAGTDWLDVLTREARKRGLKTGVEISHTMIGSDRLAELYPDVRQMDIFGQPMQKTHIGDHHFVPCMNHPDFRAYVHNLCRELADYDIDYLLNCMMPYPLPAPYLLTEYEEDMNPLDWFLQSPTGSGCFCPSCVARAKEKGVDLPRIQGALLRAQQRYAAKDPRKSNASVLQLMLQTPEFMDWIRFKCDSVSSFYQQMNQAIKKARANLDNRLNLYVTSHPEYAGLDLAALKPHFDSVRVCCYTENLGRPQLVTNKQRVLQNAVDSFDGLHVLSALGVLSGATGDSLRAGIAAAKRVGIESFALGHYDGASFEMLKAVGEALT